MFARRNGTILSVYHAFMLVLITYDVNTQDASGRSRLSRIAKMCVNYGQRVQNSVFECSIDYGTYLTLRERLQKLMDPDKDSLRIYLLGNRGAERVEHFGARCGYDPQGPLIL